MVSERFECATGIAACRLRRGRARARSICFGALVAITSFACGDDEEDAHALALAERDTMVDGGSTCSTGSPLDGGAKRDAGAGVTADAGDHGDAGARGVAVTVPALKRVEVSKFYCEAGGRRCGGGDEAIAFGVDFELETLTVKYCRSSKSGGYPSYPTVTRPLAVADLGTVRAALQGLRAELAIITPGPGPMYELAMTTSEGRTASYSPLAMCGPTGYMKLLGGYDAVWKTIAGLAGAQATELPPVDDGG